MSNFEILRRIECIEAAYEMAKHISILFGANPELFVDSDSDLEQLKKMVKDKVAEGVAEKPGTDDKTLKSFHES